MNTKKSIRGQKGYHNLIDNFFVFGKNFHGSRFVICNQYWLVLVPNLTTFTRSEIWNWYPLYQTQNTNSLYFIILCLPPSNGAQEKYSGLLLPCLHPSQPRHHSKKNHNNWTELTTNFTFYTPSIQWRANQGKDR